MAVMRNRADSSVAFWSPAEGVDVARMGGPTSASASAPQYRATTVAKFPFKGGTDTAGGIFAWTPGNDLPNGAIVTRVVLNVTTASTAACAVHVGTGSTATTSNNGLFDTFSVAATGLACNISHPGTNGKPAAMVANGAYVTCSTASGASAGLVGTAYIEYIPA